MKENKFQVDFKRIIEDNQVLLTSENHMINTNGKIIELFEGLKVELFSTDFSSCSEKDNLIASGEVRLNTHPILKFEAKWICQLDKKGIYNESQKVI